MTADTLVAVLVLGVGVWLGGRVRALQLDVRDLLVAIKKLRDEARRRPSSPLPEIATPRILAIR